MELTATKKEHLINFLDAFETDPCSDIIQLKEDKKNIYQNFIWELHQEESPNNWRYNTIFYLLDSVVNQYDFETIEKSFSKARSNSTPSTFSNSPLFNFENSKSFFGLKEIIE